MKSHKDIVGKILPNLHLHEAIREYFPHFVASGNAENVKWVAKNVGHPFCHLKFSKITGTWYADTVASKMHVPMLTPSPDGTWLYRSDGIYFVNSHDAIQFKLTCS